MAIMQITTVMTGVNILLILALLYVYQKNIRTMRSMFTSGLFIFAMLFLIQNAVSLYYAVTMMPLYADGLENFVFIYTLLQAMAFGVLTYITWK